MYIILVTIEVLNTIFYSHWYSYGTDGLTMRVFSGLWAQQANISGIFVWAQFGADGTVYLNSPYQSLSLENKG